MIRAAAAARALILGKRLAHLFANYDYPLVCKWRGIRFASTVEYRTVPDVAVTLEGGTAAKQLASDEAWCFDVLGLPVPEGMEGK